MFCSYTGPATPSAVANTAAPPRNVVFGSVKTPKMAVIWAPKRSLGLSGETDNPAHAKPRDKIFKSVIRNVAVRGARYRVLPRPAANVVFSWRGKSSRSGIISPAFDSP